MSIDGYEDVAEEDSALFCAVLKQPISVGIDGGAIDFQLYTGVSLTFVSLCNRTSVSNRSRFIKVPECQVTFLCVS